MSQGYVPCLLLLGKMQHRELFQLLRIHNLHFISQVRPKPWSQIPATFAFEWDWNPPPQTATQNCQSACKGVPAVQPRRWHGNIWDSWARRCWGTCSPGTSLTLTHSVMTPWNSSQSEKKRKRRNKAATKWLEMTFDCFMNMVFVSY